MSARAKNRMTPDGRRLCNLCGPQPLTAFGRNRSVPDGLDRWCLRCKAKRERQRRVERPELERARRQRSNQQLKLRVIDHYGGACACCGDAHIEFLCIDHIDGGERSTGRRSAAARPSTAGWSGRGSRTDFGSCAPTVTPPTATTAVVLTVNPANRQSRRTVMANALYDRGREGFLAGDVDWDANNIKAVLVDTGAYTPDVANHQFLSDIPSGARVATSPNLGSKTTTAGVADAADTVFTAVSGPSVEAIVIYQDTGTATTSRLIAYIDTATGLPVTPNGGDVTVAWDNGSNRIFKL